VTRLRESQKRAAQAAAARHAAEQLHLIGAQHASAHAAATGHAIIASFEPGEAWFWSYQTEEFYDGPALAPPEHHPLDQPTPGPAGRVPPDWRNHLN